MLPIATPPNAVVFGSGKVKIDDMIKAGLVTKHYFCLCSYVCNSLIILNHDFNYDLMNLPEW